MVWLGLDVSAREIEDSSKPEVSGQIEEAQPGSTSRRKKITFKEKRASTKYHDNLLFVYTNSSIAQIPNIEYKFSCRSKCSLILFYCFAVCRSLNMRTEYAFTQHLIRYFDILPH